MTEIYMDNFYSYNFFLEFEEKIERKESLKKERDYLLHPERYVFKLRDLK